MKKHELFNKVATLCISLLFTTQAFCVCENLPISDKIFSDSYDAVLASSFGYNAIDATSAFADAIASDNDTIIIDTQPTPWIVETNTFANLQNKKIIFEPGVVVQAKEGAFLGAGDNLMRLIRPVNVELIGYGATLRMNRSEYLLLKGEWRHSIGLREATNVSVRGFKIEESGGDAIYIGGVDIGTYSQNISIRDITIDGAKRQGISVVSAEDVCIDNVDISNIKGTIPETGIDFEPNKIVDRIVNVTLSNSRIHNNNHSGIALAMGKLISTSIPISITVKNIYLSTNHDISNPFINTEISMGAYRHSPVGGSVLFENITLDGSQWGLMNSRKPADAYHVTFRNVLVKNALQASTDKLPIYPIKLTTPSFSDPSNLGGFHFENIYLQYETPVAPVKILGHSTLIELRDVTGKVTIVNKNATVIPIEEENLGATTLNNYTLMIEAISELPPLDWVIQ